MAVIRNRYHEPAWFVGRYRAEPGEEIEVPDETVEQRDEDGTLIAGLHPGDAFFELVDGHGITAEEFDGLEPVEKPKKSRAKKHEESAPSAE